MRRTIEPRICTHQSVKKIEHQVKPTALSWLALLLPMAVLPGLFITCDKPTAQDDVSQSRPPNHDHFFVPPNPIEIGFLRDSGIDGDMPGVTRMICVPQQDTSASDLIDAIHKHLRELKWSALEYDLRDPTEKHGWRGLGESERGRHYWVQYWINKKREALDVHIISTPEPTAGQYGVSFSMSHMSHTAVENLLLQYEEMHGTIKTD